MGLILEGHRTLLLLLLACSSSLTITDASCSGNAVDCSNVIIEGPVSKKVLSNTDINLQCLVQPEGHQVQWIKGTFALGNEATIECCERYTMNEGIDGNFNLNIQNTELEDEDEYSCQVTDCCMRSKTATLTVDILPLPTVVDNVENGIIDVYSEQNNQLICTSENGKPPPTVTWYNDQTKEKMEASSSTTAGSVNGTNNTTTIFTINPTIADNWTMYYCDVSSNAIFFEFGGSRQTYVRLNLLLTPSQFSTGMTYGSDFVIDNGESQVVTCSATNTNPTATLAWFRGNISLVNDSAAINANGTYDVSVSTTIKGNSENDGVEYSCQLYIPGNSRSYSDSTSFTVSVYYFPYAAVIGGSIAIGILLILLIILLIFCIRRSNKKKKKEQEIREREAQNTIANEEVLRQEEEREPPVAVVTNSPLNTVFNDDQGYSSEWSEATTTKPKYETTSEEETDTDSIGPPSGETFSLSSSMVRSERGSPVMMYSDLDIESTYSRNTELPTALPSPVSSMPIYYTRERQTRMLTDV